MTVSGDAPRALPAVVRSFQSRDGLLLHYHAWQVQDPRAVVRIIHGLGEHGGRYAPLAGALRDRGVASYSLDLRGHGISAGLRGHVSRFDIFLDDVEAFTRETPTRAPAFLLGHSLGGLIALRAIETERGGPLAGSVLSAPALGLVPTSPGWKRAAATVLSRLAPAVAFPNGIDPADLSHDAEEVAAYRADPLVHDRITPRLYVEMLSAMRAAAAAAPTVAIPILLLAPGDDRITQVPTALEVASRFSSAVDVRSYPGFFHESLNERAREAVVSDIIGWLEDQLS